MTGQASRPGRRVADIDPGRLAGLNAGTMAAATLTECLAVDFGTLFRACFPDAGEEAARRLDEAAASGISRRMMLGGQLLLDRFGLSELSRLRCHASDTVRGWACFMIGAAEGMPLPARLELIRPFADDRHFGVREWAWLSVRPHVAAALGEAVDALSAWASDRSERIRRFASEATRPRGVWCAHIGELKRRPELALPILEPLKADPAAYVQDSVGNWLNDAAKERPDWVRGLCDRWLQESPLPETSRICRRATRSIVG